METYQIKHPIGKKVKYIIGEKELKVIGYEIYKSCMRYICANEEMKTYYFLPDELEECIEETTINFIYK